MGERKYLKGRTTRESERTTEKERDRENMTVSRRAIKRDRNGMIWITRIEVRIRDAIETNSMIPSGIGIYI